MYQKKVKNHCPRGVYNGRNIFFFFFFTFFFVNLFNLTKKRSETPLGGIDMCTAGFHPSLPFFVLNKNGFTNILLEKWLTVFDLVDVHKWRHKRYSLFSTGQSRKKIWLCWFGFRLETIFAPCQLPHKILPALKVVKSDSKIVISLGLYLRFRHNLSESRWLFFIPF